MARWSQSAGPHQDQSEATENGRPQKRNKSENRKIRKNSTDWMIRKNTKNRKNRIFACDITRRMRLTLHDSGIKRRMRILPIFLVGSAAIRTSGDAVTDQQLFDLSSDRVSKALSLFSIGSTCPALSGFVR
jgi:hypothetical protein